jgi:hypothetical protein
MTTTKQFQRKKIGFSGPRRLLPVHQERLMEILGGMAIADSMVLVGDAKGVDAVVTDWAGGADIPVEPFIAAGWRPWQLIQRSKDMVHALAEADGMLYAFPTIACPEGLSPGACKSWKGSGTWGTVAYAVSRGVKVCVVPLEDVLLPGWLDMNDSVCAMQLRG